jgi:glucose-6-phosphate isomerase
MVKVNLGGCSSFVNDAEYKAYVEKAIAALEVLENETGAGNDFLGWKHLPSETLKSTLVADCEEIRDLWKSKGVDLVVVIGIGGSYLGAKCALEALSHQFSKQLKNKGEAPEIVFAGQNLSEEYMCELMDLVQERNAACVVIS